MDVQATFEQAHADYSASRYAQAALLFRQLSESFREQGEYRWVHFFLVWEGSAHACRDHHRRALSRFLEAIQLEARVGIGAVEPEIAWMSRKLAFTASRECRTRTLPELWADLSELEEKRQILGGARYDVHVLRSGLLASCGDVRRALDELERGLALGEDLVNGQFSRSSQIAMAVYYCLELGRLDTAEDFCEMISDCDEERLDVQASSFKARVAIERVRGGGIRLRESVEALRHLSIAAEVKREQLGRAALLDPTLGDPLSREHPAFQHLVRLVRNPGADDFATRLALADLRIAGVRYSAGLAPIDDEYHDGVSIDKPVPPERRAATLQRLVRARVSLKGAQVRANRLDTHFECYYRVAKVERRLRVLDAIRAAAESGASAR